MKPNKYFVIIIILIILASTYSIIKKRSEQNKYLEVLGLGRGYKITSIDKEKNFISIGITDGISGAGYFLKNDNGQFRVIAGPFQESPSCSMMHNLEIPQTLYGQCY